MIGIKTTVTMESTVYLDLPEGTSEEEVLKAAKKEVILPIDAINTVNRTFKNLHIHIPCTELNDWKTVEEKQEIIK